MYKINEIFLSLQGEGQSVGEPSLFVRFAGCNETCEFCDTRYHQYSEVDLNSIIKKIEDLLIEKQYPINGPILKNIRCVFTGGEPLLQLDYELLMAIHEKQFKIGIETNGSAPKKLPYSEMRMFDEMTISPKSSNYSDEVLKWATCLKLVVPVIQNWAMIRNMVGKLGKNHNKKTHLILQPITPREGIQSWQYKGNCDEAVALAFNWRRDYDEAWKVIPQTHVMMRLR